MKTKERLLECGQIVMGTEGHTKGLKIQNGVGQKLIQHKGQESFSQILKGYLNGKLSKASLTFIKFF